MEDGIWCASANALLTDMYQVTMAYGYFKSGRHNEHSVFDLFFRKCPFQGEYAIAGGISAALHFLENFRFTESHIQFLRQTLGGVDEEFLTWLGGVDCSSVKVVGIPEGSVCFPREPILRVEGPLAVCQLVETTLLNLVNFATLLSTNARRMRIAAGPHVELLEFGLRRAQGPDGALTASRNAIVGGFDATSNLLAAHLFGIPARGTNAHAFVSSFENNLESLTVRMLCRNGMAEKEDFLAHVLQVRASLGSAHEHTHNGELAAFVAYAITFPSRFVALVDTYHTLQSGVPNALTVAVALCDFGYHPTGIRLDSGDLADLSKKARAVFKQVAQKANKPEIANLRIVASDDITEERILEFNKQGHEMNVLGVGTHLVTCKAQPALGGVYKLCAVSGRPCIKLSENVAKLSLPGAKLVYRLFNGSTAVADYIALEQETAPIASSVTAFNAHDLEGSAVTLTFDNMMSLSIPLFPSSSAKTTLIEDVATAKQRCEQQIQSFPSSVTQSTEATKHLVLVSVGLRSELLGVRHSARAGAGLDQ
eukprot:c23125_g1_i1.p1 GENE.c23125_g1_i1~~c23125_g1_i1.p1  ORF type:complete len:551 (-),score=152.37 c23125_g1_i1:237-1850(-)